MTFEVGEVLGSAINAVASAQGVTPQELVFQVLKERFVAHVPPFEPRNEWERRLREAASDCGVALTDEQLSREHMYE